MPYEFIGFGAMDDDHFAYEFTWFGTMDDQFGYEFMFLGNGWQFSYEFIGFGAMDE